jgi:DNA-binding CsgD family transcriptional regulator
VHTLAALELAEGHTHADICERFGISRGTATAQLGAVFPTMEGARQSELVALVNRGGGRFS